MSRCRGRARDAPSEELSLPFLYWALLSVGGISVDGFFNTTEAVVETERRMIARAEQTVVLADHSKFGRLAMCRVCGLDSVDMLITDAVPTYPGLPEAFGLAGVRIVIAEQSLR